MVGEDRAACTGWSDINSHCRDIKLIGKDRSMWWWLKVRPGGWGQLVRAKRFLADILAATVLGNASFSHHNSITVYKRWE